LQVNTAQMCAALALHVVQVKVVSTGRQDIGRHSMREALLRGSTSLTPSQHPEASISAEQHYAMRSRSSHIGCLGRPLPPVPIDERRRLPVR